LFIIVIRCVNWCIYFVLGFSSLAFQSTQKGNLGERFLFFVIKTSNFEPFQFMVDQEGKQIPNYFLNSDSDPLDL
jgi:hypothetical protein